MIVPGVRKYSGPRVGRSASLAVVLLAAILCVSTSPRSENPEPVRRENSIVVTIVYDNYRIDERFETAWGFACVVTSGTETVLFDTGGDGNLLLRNMSVADFDPMDIDAVVVSHIHADHSGGLGVFLQANSDVELFVPKSFPPRLKDYIHTAGASMVETQEPCEVCKQVWTTGVLDGRIDEQALYCVTSSGLIVITGCSHPGIVQMAQAAQRHASAPVKAVLGGFHLMGASSLEIADVIRSLKALGVTMVAPCHCSGDETRQLMGEAFGEGYLSSGAGARFVFGTNGGAEE